MIEGETLLIKNRRVLCTSKIKSNSLCILEAGIESVLPKNLMGNISWTPLSRELKINSDIHRVKGRVFVVGAGKASFSMASELNKILGDDICSGIVLSSEKVSFIRGKIHYFKATHPFVSRKNLRYSKYLLDLKDDFKINSDDLVICLISGGGSIMLEDPLISFGQLKRLNNHLLLSGATFEEINLIRMLVSNIKAGGLALEFSPAKIIGLIINDLPGVSLDSVSSGPTCIEDEGFVKKALSVAKKYAIDLNINFEEELGTANVSNYLLADNSVALNAMKIKAKDLGYNPVILTDTLSGDPAHASVELLHEVFTNTMHSSKNCFLFGGETTPYIPRGHGKGGRNQHLVLMIHKLFWDYDLPWCVASMASDGQDYINGISGAIIDHKANSVVDIDKYILNYSSRKYFSKVGHSLIKAGNIGTNVSDLGVLIK